MTLKTMTRARTKRMSSDKKDGQIVLTLPQMKQIARCELTFKYLIEKADFEEIDVVCPDVYSYTLDDLTEAVRNLQKKDPSIKDFG